MRQHTYRPSALIRWVETFQESKLQGLTPLLAEVTRMWGFIGAQVLWMLEPFVGETSLARLAESLENPEISYTTRTTYKARRAVGE